VLARNILFFGLAVLLASAFVPAVSFAGVSAFAECAYTDSDLVCYIYADTDGDSLISAGIKLSYNTSELSTPVCEKNENDWYFGDPAGTTHAYMDPESDTTNGEVVYIVGKLNINTPAEGVNKSRALIGTATFTRTSTTNPQTDPLGSAHFFGLTLAEGKAEPYANFVNTAGSELDTGVLYGPLTVAERGDANADGTIDFQDMLAVQFYTQNGGPDSPYKDCNADGIIDFQDMLCIQNKTQN